MVIEPLEIRDRCRQNLIRYLLRAISYLPDLDHPLVLDMGCGSGVPSLTLAEHLDSTIYAVDDDEKVIDHLRKKIKRLKLSEKIVVIRQSVFEMTFTEGHFDLVIAEGLLNVIGFKQGLALAAKYLKAGGHFILHDEYRDHEKKLQIFPKRGLTLTGSFLLDEQVWWKEYYQCLESHLQGLDQNIVSKEFGNELREMAQYRKNPGLFRSVYYILKKMGTIPA
jgi:SAM-dependent methyltransferase